MPLPSSPMQSTSPTWQQALANAIHSPQVLWQLLDLPKALLPAAERAAQQFGLKVTHSYCERIQRGNPDDPLLRQVLPLGEELQNVAGYVTDPLAEEQAMIASGLLHKYRSRVLLVTTGACAIHCRYCFRRHFPYGEATPTGQHWAEVLAAIAQDDSIEEVILSGGDPLVLPDHKLESLVQQLADIPHLQRLRIHTRLPVVLPMRVNDALLSWMQRTRLQVVVVLHANHANEFNAEVYNALAALKCLNAPLLNQAVLLRGVNDNLAAQMALSKALFKGGVLPYYLHLLDKVSGAAHFAVPRAEALALYQQMQANLSGYLVPKLAEEQAGEVAKTLLV